MNKYLESDKYIETVSEVAPQILSSIEDNALNYIIYGNTIQKNGTGKNLFNPINIFNGYINSTSIVEAATCRIAYAKIIPGKTYTVSKIISARFAIGYSTNLPQAGDKILMQKTSNDSASITLAAPSTAQYLLAFVYNSNIDTVTLDEILNSIQIEEGEVATDYEPYKIMPSPELQGDIKSVGEKTKNLIPYPYSETTKTENGITFTDNGDGTITVNGTATSDAIFRCMTGTTYFSCTMKAYLSGAPKGASFTSCYLCAYTNRDNSLIDTGNGTSTYDDSGRTFGIRITIKAGTTCDNLIFKPQLEAGSVATEYEPYGYKTPIEIRKNLFDISYYMNSIGGKTNSIVRDGNDIIVYQESYQEKLSKSDLGLEDASGLVMSFDIETLSTTNDAASLQIAVRYTDNTASTISFNLRDNFKKYTIDSNGRSFKEFNIGYWGYSGSIKISNIRIENTESPNYHEPKVVNIYTKEPIRRISNTEDYIDYKNQKVVRNFEKFVYTGASGENWIKRANTNHTFQISLNRVIYLPSLCSHFTNYSSSDIDKKNGVYTANSYVLIITHMGISTIEELKAWLQELSSNNTPLTLITKTNTTPIEESIIVPELPLYTGINNISTLTDIQPSNIDVVYSKPVDNIHTLENSDDLNSKLNMFRRNTGFKGFESKQISSEDNLININDGVLEEVDNYQIHGNSYQPTRSGKNLLPGFLDGTYTTYANAQFISNIKETLSKLEFGETYFYSCKTVGTTTSNVPIGGILIYDNTVTNIIKAIYPNNKFVMDFDPSQYNRYYFYGAAPNNTEVTISETMIEKGSVGTSYEPYGAMPSIEFQSDMKSVGEKTSNLVEILDGMITVNNVNITAKNGKLKINGTANTSGGRRSFGKIIPNITLNPGTYTLSSNAYLAGLYLSDEQSNVVGSIDKNSLYGTFTITETKNLYVGFNVTINDTYDLDEVIIKLEKGSEVTEWEPYGYKTPVEVFSKNLINPKKMIDNGFTLQYDGSYYVKSAATPYRKILWNNYTNITEPLTISFEVKYLPLNNEGCKPYINYTDGTGESCFKINGPKDVQTTFTKICYTTPVGKTVKNIMWSYGTGANSTLIKDIQLEIGEVATDYEPYRSKTINVYTKEPLRQIDNYADYYDYNKNKVIRKVEEYKLTGKENIGYTDYGINRRFSINGTYLTPSDSLYMPSQYCNYGKFNARYIVGTVSYQLDNMYFAIWRQKNAFVMVSNNSEWYVSREDFINILKSLYSSGNPLTFYYVKEIEEEEDVILSSPLELECGTNTISALTTIAPSNLIVDYKTRLKDNWIAKTVSTDENGVIHEKNCKGGYSSSNKDFSMTVIGDNKQNILSGKNLLPYPYTYTTQTINGVTVTDNGDGTITVNGTATAKVIYKLGYCDGLQGTVTFSGCPDGGTNRTFFIEIEYIKDGKSAWPKDIGDGNTIYEYDHIKSIYIIINSGVTLNNAIFKPQIEYGTIVTPYEQYCGGIQSPNINYSQDVAYLKKDSKIKICGKNLFENFITDREYSNGSNIKVNNNGSINIVKKSGLSININKDIYIASGNYTLSNGLDNGNNIYLQVGTGKPLLATLNRSKDSIYFDKSVKRFYLYSDQNYDDNITIYPQLEFGKEVTPYEPYIGKELVVPCDLYGCDTWNPVTGEVIQHSNVITASTSNVNYISGSNGAAYISLGTDVYNPEGYCTHTLYNANLTQSNKEIGFVLYKSGNEYRLLFRFDINMTAEQLQTILNNNQIKFILRKETPIIKNYKPQNFIVPKGDVNIISEFGKVKLNIITANNNEDQLDLSTATLPDLDSKWLNELDNLKLSGGNINE